jgi:uncharacterized membrane protein YidH (DUF202 family)
LVYLGLGNGRFCYDSDVASVERVWMRILGVLLILLGLVLLASPLISYMRSEKIGNSRYSVKSERLIVVPRPVAVLIVVAGAVALMLSRKDRAAS